MQVLAIKSSHVSLGLATSSVVAHRLRTIGRKPDYKSCSSALLHSIKRQAALLMAYAASGVSFLQEGSQCPPSGCPTGRRAGDPIGHAGVFLSEGLEDRRKEGGVG